MGAFDHEGAISCTYASIEKEATNVRSLRARQEGKYGSHASGSQCTEIIQRRFRPDAVSAALIL